MARRKTLEAAPPNSYTAEMQAEMNRLADIVTEHVDFGRPPDQATRDLDARNASVWNVDLPDMSSIRHAEVPGDPALDAAACEAVIYTPEDPGGGLIFYVHGGGWSLMNLATHDRLMRVLSIEARMVVVGVHYRLAPENPYPAGLRDVVSAFRKIASGRTSFGLPEGPVIIAGDSAGANLAMATMLHEIEAGALLPAGAILFYGAFGRDFETPSYRNYAEGHVLTTAIMQQLWDWYTPEETTHRDPLAVPLLATDAQLRALPPLFLAAAEVDPLASDTYRLKRRLDRVGRNDQLNVELGVIHGFVLMTAFLEAARRVVRAAAQAANRFAGSG